MRPPANDAEAPAVAALTVLTKLRRLILSIMVVSPGSETWTDITTRLSASVPDYAPRRRVATRPMARDPVKIDLRGSTPAIA